MNTAAVDYKTWSKYNVTNDVFGVQKCIFVNATGGWSRADCEQKFNFLCKFEQFTRSKPFWLPAVFYSGKWIWSYGEQPGFSKWKPGEPNQCCSSGKIFTAYSRPEGWSDTSPFFRAAAVCKYKKGHLYKNLQRQYYAAVINEMEEDVRKEKLAT
ncbi:unnamed protein product [Enterobius vermicularis]|uniref:C-type lectin domain-containing protein n=1 Tax=Enterobius vermicularis TaxID=51028 RepID=A0A0N4UT60_ENTVE|nr:unnamed protein product [Enterobius vermicularis]